MYKLYDYFRSSAGFRVRIALNLKSLSFDRIPIHLVKEGGQQFSEDYRNINPQTLVPSLEAVEAHEIITQSLAIIEYLDEIHPTPPLLPDDKILRARSRSIALIIAADIHPLNNLRVLRYLKKEFEIDDEQNNAWYQHWIHLGFESIETLLNTNKVQGAYCFGDSPTLADICLIPQVYNALRFKIELDAYPRIMQIYNHCVKHPAFLKALPENQLDAE